MSDKKISYLQLGGRTLEVQIGGLAEQASGSCLVRYGDTSVLATAVMGKDNPSQGFFPLTCDYEERFYAAGKILGSRFVRREGRPSTEAVLNARLIDRAVRPLFPENFFREIQVIVTCLSWDSENDPASLGLLAASLSLGLSDIPWNGPVAVVRVAREGENFILNPTYAQREKSDLDLVLAGVKHKGEVLINMIEAGAEEVPEQIFLAAYDFAQPFLNTLLDFQEKIIQEQGKPKISLAQTPVDPLLYNQVKDFLRSQINEVLYQPQKQKRNSDIEELQAQIIAQLSQQFDTDFSVDWKALFEKEMERVFKENILQKEQRPDGRKLDAIRPINCEIGLLTRTHGSALFSRGETKVLSILTLGSPGDQLLMENMEFSGKKRFLHHYNFPPYCTGEVKKLGSPGRREIGHGMLAEKALLPVIPSFDEFPYTIRIVSEVVSSNGSTSMASVAAASLALMQAGVPIKRAVAGISIGLVSCKDLSEYKLLTDIQGPEDHFGEMDFKVAGTSEGITAIQMDVKNNGINKEIFFAALQRARQARMEILQIMSQTIDQPNKELSPYAPKVKILQVNPEKIGMIIGFGGKVINEIINTYDVSIDIENDGRVFITGPSEKAVQDTISRIKEITRDFEVGEKLTGKVKRILNFGAMVEISPKQEGLVHISELAPFRVNAVSDVVKIGDEIPVKIIKIDEQGRVDLSAKQAGFCPQPKKNTSSPWKNPKKHSR